MPPILAIFLLSNDLRDALQRLAYAASVEPRILRDLGELRSLPGTCAALIAAPGAEPEALRLLAGVRNRYLREIALVGADPTHRTAASAFRSGADHYFVLPEDQGELRAWIEEQARAAPGATRPHELYDFGWLRGTSPPLMAALERAARVIPHGNATVLITGETGTGKELLAHAIHKNGPRRNGPFIGINCNALPANLLEAELFGYERGAFTDARAAKPGLFEAADGGTLFLDEIGDLSLDLQGKLLRVLENRRVRRLGSVRDTLVDVRIIAATNVNLAERARTGHFRTDLYYRLNVVPIHIPALRDRGEDVLVLTQRFLEHLGEEYRISPGPVSPAVRRALLAHPWPGNVRELRNTLERSLVLGSGTLRVQDLVNESAQGSPATPVFPFPASMEEIERAVARSTVARCGGNKSQAAELLGISRKRLYVLLAEAAPDSPPPPEEREGGEGEEA